jgi:hypothetical protein
MAYSLISNRPASAVSSEIAVHPLVFSTSDYREFRTSETETIYRSTTGSDLAGVYDTYAKLSVDNIGNVYSDSVDRRLRLPSAGGVKAYLQLIENQKAADPTDPTLPEYLSPLSSSLAVTIQKNVLVSVDAVKSHLRYLLGLLLWDNEEHLASLFRGVVKFVDGVAYIEVS